MPRPKSERPLRKVTLNLHEDSVRELERYYGWGWSEVVRGIVDEHVMSLQGERNVERD